MGTLLAGPVFVFVFIYFYTTFEMHSTN